MRVVRLTGGMILAAVAFVFLASGVAAAADYPISTPPQVLGNTFTNPGPGPSVGAATAVAPQAVTNPAPATQVLGSTLSRSSGLPVTGGDIAGLSLIGLVAIGTGTLLVRRTRPRRGS